MKTFNPNFMKTIVILLIAALLCVACECEDQQRLTQLEIAWKKNDAQIKTVSNAIQVVDFGEDPDTYFILEDELSNLIFERAFIEIDIEILKRDSKCL